MMNESGFYYGTYTPEGYYTPYSSAKNKYYINTCSHSVRENILNSIKCECVNLYDDKGLSALWLPERSILISGYETADGECIYSDMTHEYAQNIRRCSRFLLACRFIGNDIRRLESKHIDIAKLNRFCTYLWHKYGGGMTGRVGIERKRLISSITADGVEVNFKAFDDNCDNVLVLSDKSGVCSSLIVDRLRGYALSSGYDVISCVCPLNVSGVAEHLIVPQLRFGVFTSKHYHRADFEKSRRIFAGRFISPEVRQSHERINFSFKAYRKMMSEAFDSLAKADRCIKATKENGSDLSQIKLTLDNIISAK